MSLATVFPPGGKSGSEVTLTVAGSALEEIDRLHFSHPGITAAKKPEANAFAVTIGAEVPVGIYDVRVAGRQGISNPRVFVVGHLPEGVEAKANNQPDAAVELANGSVFNGTVPAAAREFFKISAKKGERLVVECAAGELDSRLSPVLAILDSMGKEISRGGGLLDFVAPADGDYRLQLHDLAFAGGPEYFYRLTLTNGPHVDFLFPAAGLPGTKSRFTLFGRNLPGSTPEMGLEKLEVEIELPASHDSRADGLGLPASAVIDGFSYRFNGVANPRFIAFAASPVIQEQEPNNRPAEAQPLPVPCEVAGRFYPAADSDSFTFEAKKGEVYWIEVFSSRSGVPTHPFLLVQHDKGVPQESYGSDVNAGGTRFNTAGGDPVVRFEVKEEGLHRILVRDLFGGTRNDPRGVYRLVVRRETPDFRLAAIVEFPPSKPDDRAAVPRASLLHGGGTSAVRVIALRQDNFNGEIALSAEGLPEGITFAPATILPGKNDALLLLTATEQAPRWTGPIRITGRAKIGAAASVHEARGGTVVWPIPDYNNEPVPVRLTRDFPIAVSGVDMAPVSVEPVEKRIWEAASGGKLEIPLKILRREEFKEALKLKAFGAPGVEALKEIEIGGEAAAFNLIIDLAAVKIPEGTHTIAFSGQTKGKIKGKEVTLTLYSAPVEIAIKAPEQK